MEVTSKPLGRPPNPKKPIRYTINVGKQKLREVTLEERLEWVRLQIQHGLSMERDSRMRVKILRIEERALVSEARCAAMERESGGGVEQADGG